MNWTQERANEAGRIVGTGVQNTDGTWTSKCEIAVYGEFGSLKDRMTLNPTGTFASHDDAARAAVDAGVEWFDKNVPLV